MRTALRDEVLALPAPQRAELAEALLDSLDDQISADDGDAVDRAWGDEMVRRSAEVSSGVVSTMTWDEVRAQVAEDRRTR